MFFFLFGFENRVFSQRRSFKAKEVKVSLLQLQAIKSMFKVDITSVEILKDNNN